MQSPALPSSARRGAVEIQAGSPENCVPGASPTSTSVPGNMSQPFGAEYFSHEGTSQTPMVENLSAQQDSQSQETSLGVRVAQCIFRHNPD